MDDREIALECVRISATITSASVHDRATVVAETAEVLYKAINDMTESSNEPDVVNADTPKRGRPRKPRAE